MKAKNIISISIALLALAFTACQREDIDEGFCDVRVRAYMQDAVTVTRGYTNVTQHPDYQDRDFAAELFVSNGERVTRSYLNKRGTALTTSLQLEMGKYWFHGYAPWRENAATCTATATASTMTITGIPGLDTQNLMLIKKDEALDVTNTNPHTVALKMDHLMAKVTPRFYIDEKYAELRSIRIKQVHFLIDGAAVYTAEASYNNTASPTTYDVVWTSTATQDLETQAYRNDNPAKPLEKTKDKALACGECFVCPAQTVANLRMRVVYDVYDTQGVRTRIDEEAENKVNIKVEGNKLDKLTAGTNYVLNIKVIPTYLYSLSDNDEEFLLLADD